MAEGEQSSLYLFVLFEIGRAATRATGKLPIIPVISSTSLVPDTPLRQMGVFSPPKPLDHRIHHHTATCSGILDSKSGVDPLRRGLERSELKEVTPLLNSES